LLEVAELPKVPGLPSGSTSDSMDPEEIYSAFEQLSAKLGEAEQTVYAALKPTVPEVSIQLPRLHPSMLAAERRAVDRADPYAALMAAEEGIKECVEQAAEAASEYAGSLKAAAAAALTSLLVAVGIAFVSFGGAAGPMVSAAQAVLVNFAAFALSWQSRCSDIFDAVEGKQRDVMEKVLESHGAVRRQVTEIFAGMEAVLDRLIEEQSPNLAHFEAHEASLRAIKPDFDVPSPEELKKPLEMVSGMIDGVMEDVKALLPAKLKEHQTSTFAGKLTADRSQFDLFAVQLPLGLLLLVNLCVAVCQVLLVASVVQTPAPEGATSIGHRQPGQIHAEPAFELPPNLMPIIMPALVQILLALSQTAAAAALFATSRVCDHVNGVIESGEAEVNAHANAKVKEVAEMIFSSAFAEVQRAADDFFPKFKECIASLRPILQRAAEASALAKKARLF